MSKLEGLRAKPITIELDGVELELKSLTVGEMAQFAEYQEKKNLKGAIEYMILTTLRKTAPDATDDELQNIKPSLITKLIEQIGVVNGFDFKKKLEADNDSALSN